jgi:hypothetical protein
VPRLAIPLTSWQTPLVFTSPDHGPVFTFTLVLPLIVETFRGLRQTIDAEPVDLDGETHERVRSERHARQVEAVRRLTQVLGYDQLGDLARRLELPVPLHAADAPVSDVALLELVQHGDVLGEWAHNAFADFPLQLRRAARERTRPPESGYTGVLGRYLDRHGHPTRLERFRTAGGEPVWAWRLHNLVQRCGLEMLELFTRRPRMASCRICDRVFVREGRETRCSGNLWSLGQGDLVAYCRTDYVPAAPRADHERRRDAAYKRLRRLEQQKANLHDPNAIAALDRRIAERTAEYEGMLLPRGPSPKPFPPVLPGAADAEGE